MGLRTAGSVIKCFSASSGTGFLASPISKFEERGELNLKSVVFWIAIVGFRQSDRDKKGWESASVIDQRILGSYNHSFMSLPEVEQTWSHTGSNNLDTKSRTAIERQYVGSSEFLGAYFLLPFFNFSNSSLRRHVTPRNRRSLTFAGGEPVRQLTTRHP